MSRPSWDDYFYNIAEIVSLRSTCLRARCGAVVSKNNRILGTGYNGSPPDEPHCIDEGCLMEDDHCQRSIHAEVNAIVHSQGDLNGASIYVYKNNIGDSIGFLPCRECLKVIRSAGIRRIVGWDVRHNRLIVHSK